MFRIVTATVLSTLLLGCAPNPVPTPAATPAVAQAPVAASPVVQAPVAAEVPEPTPPAPPPPPSLPDTLAGALEAYTPLMNDQGATDDMPAGLIRLVLWSVTKMTWAAIQAQPTSKRALVFKDSEPERGKRICVSGIISEISVERLDEGKVAHVGLYVNGDVYMTVAVGSTGELVEQSNARFCGVVVGKFSYSNSGGGTTHAVRLVGMFDLKANRAP